MSKTTQFDYLLNAFEQASQADQPADHGYGEKRKALLAYVRNLEGDAWYKDAWNGAVAVCKSIAERVGYDTTKAPPEGIRTALTAVEDYCDRMEAALADAAAREKSLLADVKFATGVEYDKDSLSWWVPAEPGPIECDSFQEALVKCVNLPAQSSRGEAEKLLMSLVRDPAVPMTDALTDWALKQSAHVDVPKERIDRVRDAVFPAIPPTPDEGAES